MKIACPEKHPLVWRYQELGRPALSIVIIPIVNQSAFKGVGDSVSNLSLPSFKVIS